MDRNSVNGAELFGRSVGNGRTSADVEKSNADSAGPGGVQIRSKSSFVF
ncbi:MAG: hypothetical protein DVB28_001607 [Verrucomicrobia bacterium]|nr:MAG: hypothetical protein DVB28_001607 [Verrucomicrobiota bacterium]